MNPELQTLINKLYPDIESHQMDSVIKLFEYLDLHGNNVQAVNYDEKLLIDGLDRAVEINSDPNFDNWKTLNEKIIIAKHHILD